MTPSTTDSRLDSTASGKEPRVPVRMKNPPSFLTFAPRTRRKFIAWRTCALLKMGVNESRSTVTGPLASPTLLLTWMLTSVKSIGSLIDVSPPTSEEEQSMNWRFPLRSEEHTSELQSHHDI